MTTNPTPTSQVRPTSWHQIRQRAQAAGRLDQNLDSWSTLTKRCLQLDIACALNDVTRTVSDHIPPNSFWPVPDLSIYITVDQSAHIISTEGLDEESFIFDVKGLSLSYGILLKNMHMDVVLKKKIIFM